MAARTLKIRYEGRVAESRVVFDGGGLDRLGAHAAAGRAARDGAASSRPRGTKVPARRALLISEPRVARLYARRALASLKRRGIDATLVLVPTGERAKSARELSRLWDVFAARGLGRHDLVVALGGGSVGDLAGFAAASWLRGIEWVGVPTSLLAQVDSSVGGKTAIDIAAGKNLAGAFHQPSRVIIDPQLLATLPQRQLRAGLAEIVKLGMAVDAALFRDVERHAAALAAADPQTLARIIERSVRAKARVTRADEHEREGGSRTALNFGHTLGHALEAVLGYKGLLHGEAVAIGLRVASRLSVEAAGLDLRDRDRLLSLLEALRLPKRIPGLPLRALMAAMRHDKKGRNGNVRWVLTPQLGHASVPRLIPSRLVEAALIEAGARR